jgi:hypothetical protein
VRCGAATWAYWFKEVGASKFPDTWDEWRNGGIALKKEGQPMGQAFGHSLGDPNNWAYSVTWGFGGAEIDQSGKVLAAVSRYRQGHRTRAHAAWAFILVAVPRRP